MKVILLFLLVPLVKCSCMCTDPSWPKISVSCFLLGDWGCEVKCNLKCLLLGCVAQNVRCDGWSRCICNEIYSVGEITLTNDDFENLDFIVLWNSIFATNEASRKILEYIKTDDELEVYLLKLLRDPYMTGEDIISILRRKYPTWKAINSLESLQHGYKTEIMEAGNHIGYGELDANMAKLSQLIQVVPPDDMENSQYLIRVKNFLKNITNVDDLEEILYLVGESGNQNLYRLVKLSLKNMGYGFEEDGDDLSGKKAILRRISLDLEDADDDEKLEVAIAKNFMPTKRGSNSSPKQKILNEEDIDNVFTLSGISIEENQNNIKNTVSVAPAISTIVPPIHAQQGGQNYFPWNTSAGLTASNNNNNGNAYWNSVGYTGYSVPMTGYDGYGNVISSVGQPVDKNNPANKMYILVVDSNGNVVQTNEIPKKP